jgi:hypothetical protein
MKRSPKSEFDDQGVKWFESPAHKEAKYKQPHPGGSTGTDSEMLSESGESVYTREEKELNLKSLKEKFYDFIKILSKYPELRIDYNYLNQNLTIKIDKILDIPSTCEIFEKLCSRVIANPRIKKNWSEEETTLFIWLTLHYCHLKQRDFTSLEGSDWVYIASVMPGKKSEQCKYRWQSLLKVNLSKVPWTQKEDEILVQIIREKGTKQWKDIAKELNARTGFKHYRHGKQCRERWINHLDPNINRGSWTTEEDIALLKCQLDLGKKWADIAKALGSRTENAVKNRWNSLIKKYRIEFGIEGDQIAAQTLLRKSNNYTTEEIERKICLMIIDSKEREVGPDGDKTIIKKIEASDTLSRMNEETSSQTDSINEKIEEDVRPEKSCRSQQGEKRRQKKNADVDKSKNLLRDLVNQERDNLGMPPSQAGNNFNPNTSQFGNTTLPYTNPMSAMSNPMKYFPFANPFNNNQLVQNPLQVGKQGSGSSGSLDTNKLMQQNPLLNNSNFSNNPLMGGSSMPNLPLGNLFNLNDMVNLNILLLNNPNNLMKAGQQNLLHGLPTPEKIGLNSMGYPIQAKNLPGSSTNTDFSDHRRGSTLDNIEEAESKAEELNSRTSFENDDTKSQYIRLKQVPYNDFKISENAINNNQVLYAMVDLSTKQLCYITAMTKDTAPPAQMNKFSNMNINPSPLFSPMQLLSSPMVLQNQLFNNNLTNLGGNTAPLNKMKDEFNKMHISPPSIPKSIEDSPDMSNPAYNKKQEAEKSSEWTPEIEKKNIFANLGNMGSRDHLTSGNFDLCNSSLGTPDTGALFKGGSGAFRRQPGTLGSKEEIMQSIGLSGIDLKGMENNPLLNQLKPSDSPSLFLNSSRLHSGLI